MLAEWGNTIAFRCLPINRLLRNGTIKLNNSQVSSTISDNVKVIERFGFDKCDYMSTPRFPDNCQSYSECTQAGAGSQINVLGALISDKKRRGDYPYELLTADTTTRTVIRVEFTEPIMMSPLSYKCTDTSLYFANLQEYAFNAVLNDVKTSILSISANCSSVFTQINPVITSAILETEYIQSLNNVSSEESSYEYFNINRQLQTIQSTVAPNSDVTISTNNVIIASLPKLIYVLIAENETSRTVNSTDTFCEIKNVTVTLNGRSSELASTSQHQLYQMAKKNGCDLSYEEWTGNHYASSQVRQISGVGSIVAINAASDIGGYFASGEISSNNIQLKVVFSSLRPVGSAPVQFSIYSYFVSDGLVTLYNGGKSSVVDSFLTQTDIMSAPVVNVDVSDFQESSSAIGGSLGSWIREKGWPWLRKNGPEILKIAKQVAPLVGLGCGSVGGMHPKYHHGCTYCQKMQEMDGMGLIGGCDTDCNKGYGMIGGQKLSRKTLKNLLR